MKSVDKISILADEIQKKLSEPFYKAMDSIIGWYRTVDEECETTHRHLMDSPHRPHDDMDYIDARHWMDNIQ